MPKTQLSFKWSPTIEHEDYKPILYLSPNPHLADFCNPLAPAKEVQARKHSRASAPTTN
jgi:hypothetical protein